MANYSKKYPKEIQKIFDENRRQLENSLSKDQKIIYDGLNDQQKYAFESVVSWSWDIVDDPYSGGHIIVGAAGTGKTTVLKMIAAYLDDVVLCAPTNKAVKELIKLGTDLDCCTIYSLLGLTMKEDEDNMKLVKTEESRVEQYSYVILDECGMVNSELFKYIEKAIKKGVRFIFVGDPEQLPPVGEDESPVWENFSYSKLTRVMRHDNQILEFATHVRKLKSFKDLRLESNNDKKEGVWKLDGPDFADRIRKYAENGYFDDRTKALAWRNKTVDTLNNIVRQVIFGKDVHTSKYLINDKVVFTKPYDHEYMKIFTDDEAVVKDVSVAKHTDYPTLMCYYLSLQFDKRICVVKTLHEDSETDFQNLLSFHANEARKPKCGHLWADFWELNRSMCYLKYSYALTVHRSQGSTYKYAFVDVNDILHNRNRLEAKKCLYTAVTRPQKRLFLR